MAGGNLVHRCGTLYHQICKWETPRIKLAEVQIGALFNQSYDQPLYCQFRGHFNSLLLLRNVLATDLTIARLIIAAVLIALMGRQKIPWLVWVGRGPLMILFFYGLLLVLCEDTEFRAPSPNCLRLLHISVKFKLNVCTISICALSIHLPSSILHGRVLSWWCGWEVCFGLS